MTRVMYPDEDPTQNMFRRDRILDYYINMPDKTIGDTPLHYASKFGMLGMVELLMEQPQINPELKNRNGDTAGDVVCSRSRINDPIVEGRIKNLIQGLVYIPVYKEFEYSAPSSLGNKYNIISVRLHSSKPIV